MFTLPQLIEEDVEELNAALSELLQRTEASTAILIDKGGFTITTQGVVDQYDTTTLAALAAASFIANQAIANLISEPNFCSIYQQGEQHSMLVDNVDEHCLLVVIFQARLSVGAVKYFGAATLRRIAAQINRAKARAPEAGLDLSMLNLADTAGVFHKAPRSS